MPPTSGVVSPSRVRPVDQSLRVPVNQLLRGLPPHEYRRLAPCLHPVSLKLREVLYANQSEIAHVYFPETAMISLVTEMQNGTTVEMGVAGRFGMAGLSAFLGTRRAGNDAIVQMKGEANRMSVADLRRLVTPGTRLYTRLLQYTQSFLLQSGQAAACNALHSLSERCARWLLTVADQIGTDSFELTHEFLSHMLGVRRAGVTTAQASLRNKGLIASRRGNVEIRDRAGLELAACECYRIIRKESMRDIA